MTADPSGNQTKDQRDDVISEAASRSLVGLIDRILRHQHWTVRGVIVALFAMLFGSQPAPAEPELLCQHRGARALGWLGSGHKTHFCKNAGFDHGNFNIPGSRYDAGVICIDMASEPSFADYGGRRPENVRCDAIDGEKHYLLYPD